MTASILDEPIVASIAQARGMTAAPVHLAWMYKVGIATNPRSMDVQHMQENLQAPLLANKLNGTDVMHMMSFPQDFCSLPDEWYECAP
jgi:diketogulonate reductase-like aldo/keto reductase